ncbi:MAG: hypothetical protein C5B47_04275 [Verrucomicrobia bacterium]|nr:MAG: hypothetical protein C5B47_04275 [Verrucomicrobiota bacterium]
MPKKIIRDSIPRNAIRMGLCVQVLLILLILSAINYISFNYYWRADFSRNHRFSLADQTKRALQSLNQRAKIYVVTSPTTRATESSLYQDLRNLLKELQLTAKGNLSVEFVDPTRDPIRARTLQTRLKYGDNENLVILEYNGESQFVKMAEFGSFDFSPVSAGRPPRLVAFRGEQILTDAIISLLSPGRHKVFFLVDDGEPEVSGPNSQLSTVVDYAARQNVAIEPLRLGALNAIPAEADAVVIVAPRFDVSAENIEKLRKYWDQGGNLMVLLDPTIRTPVLNKFISSLGILPEDDRVIRSVPAGFKTNIDRAVRGRFLPKAEPSKRLIGATAYFPGNTQSLTLQPQTSATNHLQLRPIVQAEEGFWGERDYNRNFENGLQYDATRDIGYPVVIAASAERDGLKDERVDVQSAKLVVVGNSEFAMNRWLGGTNATAANLDFILGCLNWLIDRGNLASIVPKSPTYFYLNLTNAQLREVAFNTIVAIPGAVAFIGLLVWLRRRK